MPAEPTVLYVCPNCFSVDKAPGTCPECGHTRVECDPGDPDNPWRRPPTDAEGRLLSRAPLWWLARAAPYLRSQLKQKMNR